MFKRNKFRPCINCQKPVIPEDKNCPYCGSPVRKDVLPKLIIGVLLLILFSTLAFPTKSKSEKEREEIANGTVATFDLLNWAKNLDNKGVLNKIGEIEGKIVELKLKVFMATYMSGYFGVITIPSEGIPGAMVMLYPKNKAETDFLRNAKSGHTIKIRGKIKGAYLKRIKIDPAFII